MSNQNLWQLLSDLKSKRSFACNPGPGRELFLLMYCMHAWIHAELICGNNVAMRVAYGTSFTCHLPLLEFLGICKTPPCAVEKIMEGVFHSCIYALDHAMAMTRGDERLLVPYFAFSFSTQNIRYWINVKW